MATVTTRRARREHKEWPIGQYVLASVVLGAIGFAAVIIYGLWISDKCMSDGGLYCVFIIADADKSPGSHEDTRPWFLP